MAKALGRQLVSVRRLQRVLNKCLRTLAGVNRYVMWQRRMGDEDVRRTLGAQPIRNHDLWRKVDRSARDRDAAGI